MSNRDQRGRFIKGHTGNPGGKSALAMAAAGLSPTVKQQEGLKFWRRLLELRDGLIKEAYVNDKGETVYSVPSIKEFLQICEVGLAYCFGRPSQRVELPIDKTGPIQINFFLGSQPDGSKFGFHAEGRRNAIDNGEVRGSGDTGGGE